MKEKRTVILILCLTVVLAVITELKSLSSRIFIKDNCLQRPEGTEQVELDWVTEAEKGTIVFEINPKRVPTGEREELFREAEQYIRNYIQAGNDSLRAMRGDVQFPESVPGSEVTVSCRPGSYRWLNADGSRTMQELPEEGAEEILTVTMRYYEEEREFVLELLLLPKGSEAEQFQKKVETEILSRIADNTTDFVYLPEQIGDVPVEWSVRKKSEGIIILFLGLIAAACFLLSGKKKQEEIQRKREEELLADYPELVSKYLLLLNAGLSQRSVWERMASDYKKSGRSRCVYEEMLLTMREMENGISEAKAYERFGKRCKLLQYIRFSGVLVQTLQKGAKGNLALLEQEALVAFSERKDAAKKKGEEAGTKLLLPMFGLLGIVLVIVMFPAFYSL